MYTHTCICHSKFFIIHTSLQSHADIAWLIASQPTHSQQSTNNRGEEGGALTLYLQPHMNQKNLQKNTPTTLPKTLTACNKHSQPHSTHVRTHWQQSMTQERRRWRNTYTALTRTHQITHQPTPSQQRRRRRNGRRQRWRLSLTKMQVQIRNSQLASKFTIQHELRAEVWEFLSGAPPAAGAAKAE